jgi:hypothetical protein
MSMMASQGGLHTVHTQRGTPNAPTVDTTCGYGLKVRAVGQVSRYLPHTDSQHTMENTAWHL